jgi:hypothetical protein
MKINYRNTCLHFLDHPEKMDFYLPDTNKNMSDAELREFAHGLKGIFKDLALKEKTEHSGFFRQKVRLLTRPFLEAFEKGKSRLVDVFDKEEMEETGVFLNQYLLLLSEDVFYRWRVDRRLVFAGLYQACAG